MESLTVGTIAVNGQKSRKFCELFSLCLYPFMRLIALTNFRVYWRNEKGINNWWTDDLKEGISVIKSELKRKWIRLKRGEKATNQVEDIYRRDTGCVYVSISFIFCCAISLLNSNGAK